MVDNGRDREPALRPVPSSGGPGPAGARGEPFQRAGWLVCPDRNLGQLVARRPAGITAHQWSTASRTRFRYVVADPASHLPVFAVACHDPARLGPDAAREHRMAAAVCATVGLGLLRVESTALAVPAHARRVVEYVLDAWTFTAATGRDEGGDPAPGFRDIVGRLPDGRTGFVNDLGAVARAAAVDAYVGRQLADPIIRGLSVCWAGGPAEGWAWLDVRDGWCLFERTRVWQHRFSCGVDPGRLAEDLAVAAIGERLKTLDALPPLHDKQQLAGQLDALRARRAEMDGGFAFDHVSFA